MVKIAAKIGAGYVALGHNLLFSVTLCCSCLFESSFVDDVLLVVIFLKVFFWL